VEDADECTDEVVGVGVRTQIAAGDGALDRGYEGSMDADCIVFSADTDAGNVVMEQ
jgi:hypothetical protein